MDIANDDTCDDQDLNSIIDNMIKQRELDPQEIQSKIDKNIYFRYNSVNLVIGKRGSGKTYTTLREILKLSLTNHKEYTQLHYITDKVRDDTVDKFKDIFSKSNIWFNWVPVTNAEKLITTLAKAKALKKAGETAKPFSFGETGTSSPNERAESCSPKPRNTIPLDTREDFVKWLDKHREDIKHATKGYVQKVKDAYEAESGNRFTTWHFRRMIDMYRTTHNCPLEYVENKYYKPNRSKYCISHYSKTEH